MFKKNHHLDWNTRLSALRSEGFIVLSSVYPYINVSGNSHVQPTSGLQDTCSKENWLTDWEWSIYYKH